jgi:dynein intermediate chain 2, axonemal
MELEYSLSSFRSQQGLPVEFEDTKPEVMGIVSSTSAYDKYYVIRNTAVLEGDTSPDIGVSRVQTSDKVSVSQGMNHVEGGWPQEVDTESSAELKERIRGRILRADEILPAVNSATKKMDYCMNQNIAVDIYEHYFSRCMDGSQSDTSYTQGGEDFFLQETTTFSDPSFVRRPAISLSWSPTDSERIACGYCNQPFLSLNNGESLQGYVWNIHHPTDPESELVPQSPIRALAFRHSGQQILCGSRNGVLSLFDRRNGSHPVSTSSIDSSHHEPVRQVAWLNTRSGFETVSVSTDGCLCFWDTRRLTFPTVKRMLKCPSIASKQPRGALGGSGMIGKYISAGDYNFVKKFSGNYLRGTCVSVDPTYSPDQSILCGTEMGFVCKSVIGQDRGKNEGKSSSSTLLTVDQSADFLYPGHISPVLSVERSKFLPNAFLTAGDWTNKVWTTELPCPINSTSFQPFRQTCAAWSPSKAGIFFSTDTRGTLKAWDYRSMDESCLYEKMVSSSSIVSLCIRPDGQYAVTGDVSGCATVLNVSSSLCEGHRTQTAAFREGFVKNKSDTGTSVRRARRRFEARRFKDQGNGQLTSPSIDDEEWEQTLASIDANRIDTEVDLHYLNICKGRVA